MAGAQGLGPPFTAFPGALLGSWIGSGAAMLELVSVWDAGAHIEY